MAQPVTILGQPSYRIASGRAEAFVTVKGGQVAPVTFNLGGREVRPFHVAPWAEEGPTGEPPIIDVLRGDFFCMPFGANEAPFGSERHPIHGETANEAWELVSIDRNWIRMRLETKIRPGEVLKELTLGDHAVYSRHTLSGMSGPMSFGHHAMLRFESEGRLSTSPIAFGQVYPYEFESPAKGGYSSLKQGAYFSSLSSVPSATGGVADLTRYPAREGFEDLVMVLSERETDLAWTAVVFQDEGYLWVSLKDPRVLPATVLWHSNGGRHYAPWSGRHRRVLGIEEVCSYFHTGLAESAAENEVSRAGYRTYHDLDPDRPLEVGTIMAVAEVPDGFERVLAVRRSEGGALLTGAGGIQIELPLDMGFLSG
ncbi:MAG TPA: hypothetical protein VGE01_00665 [Fimbriimonas sp.]